MEYKSARSDEKKERIKINRTKKVELRLTELEYLVLMDNAKAYKTVSDFVRYSCLEKRHKKLEKTTEFIKTVKELTFEISAIGKNINQVARYSNLLLEQRVKFDSLSQFNPIIADYTSTLLKVEQTLKKVLNS